MKYKNIFFDLDGTITDSKPGIFKSLEYAFEKKGLEVPDYEVLNEFLGPPLIESFKNIMGYSEELSKEMVDLFRYRFIPLGIYENEMFEGMKDLLRYLSQRKDYHIYIATAKPLVSAKTVLEYFKIDNYFEIVRGATYDGKIKNKSEVIKHLIEDIIERDGSINRDETVMVGDRDHDIMGAKDHGLKSIGVTYGYGSIPELKRAKADTLVSSVEELRKELLKK